MTEIQTAHSAPAEEPTPEQPTESLIERVFRRLPSTARLHDKLFLKRVAVIFVTLVLVFKGLPAVLSAIRTVSTDDAYVSGHATFVAPRVPGQIVSVFVDNNNRVRKGDSLAQIDKEPYEVRLAIAQSAVAVAESNLTAAKSQTRSVEGQMRSLRFNLDHAIDAVHNQVAILRARVAIVESQRASIERAQAEYDRGEKLAGTNATSKEDLGRRKENLLVAKAKLEESLQNVYQIRLDLGLPFKPQDGSDLTEVPEDLDQNVPAVRHAQAKLIQAAAQVGVEQSFNLTPKQMIEGFYKRDAQGDIDKIYADILNNAPAVKQAEAKLAQANSNLSQAELDLRYTDIKAEIDGVVTRRSVNPGNNVVAGQAILALRSLTEIWVDANFKETQLVNLRIGQPVDLDIDMYGSRARFEGRISGFTMGTGSTLALLPAENATGNFVKVVQRLPVRIDLLNYDAEKTPLFIGLSVVPHVHIYAEPTGPDAGHVLQPVSSPSSGAPPTS